MEQNDLSMTYRVLFLLFVLGWQGCCPVQQPVRLIIGFAAAPPASRTDTAMVFKRVYALGGTGNLFDSTSFYGGGYFNYGTNPFPRSQFAMPATLARDVTTYIFEGATRTDTLSIAYERRLLFVSRNCGATASIRNLRVVEPTSFARVTPASPSDENTSFIVSVGR